MENETRRGLDDLPLRRRRAPSANHPQQIKMATRMTAPLCLIENLEDGTLQVNPEAVRVLSSTDQPVVVVAIVGMYRTGKSYLMNKLAGLQKGFELGATVQAKTKGIWMLCVPHPTKVNHVLVLLDTEGLGDVVKGDKSNDMKIFCLSVLLSSALVYNSQKTIDQDAIEKLRFVGELAHLIKIKSTDNKDEEGEFSRHFPIFIWAVRDFTLKLEYNGEDITEDEYLEYALRLQKTNGEQQNQAKVKERNLCREYIRMYFKTRKCFVFEFPSGSKNVLQRMDEVSNQELKPEFVTQTQEFCKYIYKNAEVKYLDHIHPVTGKMLGQLVYKYTEDITSSDVVCMEDAVTSISKMENEAAVREATEHYEKTMRERGRFPTDTLEEFTELSAQCEEEALQIFMKKSFKDSELCFQKLYMENIQKQKKEFSEINRTTSQQYCEQLIAMHSKDLDEALKSGVFCTPGGYAKFQEAMRTIEERYSEEPRKGVQAHAVLQEFIKSKEALKISIVKADQTLSEQQKNAETDKSKDKIEELEKEMRELRASLEDKRSDDERRTTERNFKALMEKLEKQNLSLQRKLESVMQAKEREENALNAQGFHESAKMYREQKNDLNKEVNELKKPKWVKIVAAIFGTVIQCVFPKAVSIGLNVVLGLVGTFLNKK